MQRDSATYCDEPEDAEDYAAWQASAFSMQGAQPEVDKILAGARACRVCVLGVCWWVWGGAGWGWWRQRGVGWVRGRWSGVSKRTRGRCAAAGRAADGACNTRVLPLPLHAGNAFMAELQSRLVPLLVEAEVFWARYFYRCAGAATRPSHHRGHRCSRGVVCLLPRAALRCPGRI
jgi:hypothetical protein